MKNIDKQIRLEGEMLKLISPLGSERAQRILGPVSTKAMSVLKLKKVSYSDAVTDRENPISI